MALPANFSGLNVATKAGEGFAHISHWEDFYNTLNQIQQRDLTHQKAITDAALKANMEVGEVAKGIRPIDIPEFKKHADDFKTAAIALADKNIQRDPQKLSEWMKKKDDAYINAMTLAEDSKGAVKFKQNVADDVFKSKGVGYKTASELDALYKEYDNTPTRMLSSKGLNTPSRWILPPDTYPKQDYDKAIFGELKTKPVLEEVKDPNGMVMARKKNEVQYYTNDIPTIARKTAEVINGVHDVSQSAKASYDRDLKDSPDKVKSVFEDAHKLLDPLPDGQKPVLPNDYVGYATAQNILRAQPKNVGTSSYEEDPGYKRMKDEAFKREMQRASYGQRKNLIYLSNSLKKKSDQPEAINSELLYDAATHPAKQFQMKTGDGKTVTFSGREIIDGGIQAIAGNNPKNVEAVQLDRYSVVSKDGRRRIIEKLLPNLSEDRKRQLIQSPAETGEGKNKAIQEILDEINTKYQQNIKLDDINRYSIPVFISKKYVSDPIYGGRSAEIQPVFVNPAINNYGQFHSILSNQAAAKKASAMKAENPNFIQNLGSLIQDDDD